MNQKGLGWGSGRVSLALALLIILVVAYLAITRNDVQHATADTAGAA